ncbi:MAG TPA: hypothetical protein VMU13_03800 [Candidatus Paceibacterota bacterium]|nr:hypothetical protein [Candidatus Paceibacterota bacterium]
MRITLAFIGLISALTLPPWIPLVCIVLLSIRYRAWEAILIGALIDFTWLPSGTAMHSLPLCTLVAIIIVWGLEPLRQQFLLS